MAAPTSGFVTLGAFLSGGPEYRRRVRINPFSAATDGQTPAPTLPPAPAVGLVYPR